MYIFPSTEAEELLSNQYSYPAGNLIQTYKNRRGEIQEIHRYENLYF